MKDDTAPRQPRNFKDRALVWISGLLVGGHVPLVPDSPRLLRVVDRQLFAMAPTQEETDRTFLAEDDSIWSFEFQFRDSPPCPCRAPRSMKTPRSGEPGS